MSFSSGREAGNVGVRRVGQEQVDALLAEPGERAQVGEAVVERQLVHLEVAGVQHEAGGGADRDGERIRDRVVDRDELEARTGRAASCLPSLTIVFVGVSRCSRSFASTSASVRREPISGMSSRSRSR